MFILFICLAVRFLEQRNRDLPLSPRVKEVISCQASSPPPPPPPSPTGRAAPAPNPEDFSHHSSAHKLPPPPPTTTTQLPTRSARASCDAAARKACKSLDARLRERLTCQPRPSLGVHHSLKKNDCSDRRHSRGSGRSASSHSVLPFRCELSQSESRLRRNWIGFGRANPVEVTYRVGLVVWQWVGLT